MIEGRTVSKGTEQVFFKELREAVHEAAEDDFSAVRSVFVRHHLLGRFIVPAGDSGYDYTSDWKAVLECLAGIGGIDLSCARLFEGHLNALHLVGLYGTAAQQDFVLRTVQSGGMIGVWGADAASLAGVEAGAPDREWTMHGAKRYASGAGILRAALVPINQSDGMMQLLLLSTDDPARVDLSSWDHRGMRRTVSGTYSFDGLSIGAEAFVGRPDDYRREPWFVGGIWRCAAAQLGAVEALVKILANDLHASGRDEHPLQMARIGQAMIKTRTARLWIEDAAERVETTMPDTEQATVNRTVALSAYARLVTEEAAMEVIDLAERGIGLGSFATSHPAERLSRDLAVYLRQANPDAVLLQHGRVLAKDLLS